MSALLIVGAVALGATVAYHMVRPVFRNLRLSIAAFLPNPPKSDSKKTRITLVRPLSSIPFWTRILMFLIALYGLLPFLSLPFNNELFDSIAVRVIVDTSPSMSVADGNLTRLDSANSVLQETLEVLADVKSISCVEIFTVGNQISLLRKGDANSLMGTKIPNLLADDGAGAQVLSASIPIEVENSCQNNPSQAIVITDQPPVFVSQETFEGRLIWYQVGTPVQNQAVASARIIGGGLLGKAKLRINILFSGENAANSKLVLIGPNETIEPTLFQDSESNDSWYAEIDSPVKGEYQARISPGGALSIDDTLYFSVPEIEKVSVDWQIQDYPRPALLIEDTLESDIVVAPFSTSQGFPEGRFVMTYDTKWQSGELIGTFQHRHSLLNDINFDVLERNSPNGLSILPVGFVPVVTGLNHSIWVAVNADNTGVLVPSLKDTTTEDQTALATTMFFNGLDWVSNSNQNQIFNSHWITNNGNQSTKVIAEFDTNRELSTPPVLSDLALPIEANDEKSNDEELFTNLEWFLLISILFLLMDRLVGLNWRRAN